MRVRLIICGALVLSGLVLSSGFTASAQDSGGSKLTIWDYVDRQRDAIAEMREQLGHMEKRVTNLEGALEMSGQMARENRLWLESSNIARPKQSEAPAAPPATQPPPPRPKPPAPTGGDAARLPAFPGDVEADFTGWREQRMARSFWDNARALANAYRQAGDSAAADQHLRTMWLTIRNLRD